MVVCSVPCWVAYAGTPGAIQKYIVKCIFFLHRPICLIFEDMNYVFLNYIFYINLTYDIGV